MNLGWSRAADLSEAEEMIEWIEKEGGSWRHDGAEFVEWTNRWENLLRRCYELDELSMRFRDFRSAVSYPTDDGGFNFDDEEVQESFQQNQEVLMGHVRALRADVAARLGSQVENDASEDGSMVTLIPILRVFIGHDGETNARRKLEEYITALGAVPVIAEREPRKGRSVDDHVTAVMRSCSYGLVIATREKASEQDGKLVPRANAINEIERVRNEYQSRWMMMFETGVGAPSNVAEFVRSSFTTQSMDRAFIDLARELVGHGLLGVQSPRE